MVNVLRIGNLTIALDRIQAVQFDRNICRIYVPGNVITVTRKEGLKLLDEIHVPANR